MSKADRSKRAAMGNPARTLRTRGGFFAPCGGGVPGWACLLALAWIVFGLPAPSYPGTTRHFIFNNDSEPETLDPHRMTGLPEIRLALALFEGLTTLDPETLDPRPGLAEHWTIDEDGTRYTFHLRPEAAWSDGTPLTSEDIAGSWKRILTPATGAAYANLLFEIRQARDFFLGKIDDFAAVGVRTDGPHRMVVDLEQPCPYFLELTAFPAFFPLPLEVIAQHGERWTRPEHMLGNGPFVLAQWSPRRRIVLHRNERFREAGRMQLEQVTALPLDDLNTAYRLFLQGEIHWMPSIPQMRVEEIRRHPDYYVHPYFGTYFYRFNTTRPPFDDARVRRAFVLATDREEITAHVLGSGQIPFGGFCPPIAGYEPVAGLPYDPARARALLEKAGYSPSANPLPSIEILYNTSETHKMVAEALAAQWQRNLRVRAIPRNVEWKTLLQDMRSLNYQVCRSSWIGDYGDPSTFFHIMRSDDGNNRTGWSHPRYDALGRQAQSARDPALRYDLFREMERILVEEECPVLPVYRYVTQGLISPRVSGWKPNERGLIFLHTLRMEKE